MRIIVERSPNPALHRSLVIGYAATHAFGSLVFWIEIGRRVSGPLVTGLVMAALLVWGLARGSIIAWRIAVALAILGFVIGLTNFDEPLGRTQIGVALVHAALLVAMRQKAPELS